MNKKILIIFTSFFLSLFISESSEAKKLYYEEGKKLFSSKKYKEAKKQLELAVIFMASDPVVNDHYADALWMNNKSLQARYYWNYVLKLEKTEEKLKNEVKQKLLFGLKR